MPAAVSVPQAALPDSIAAIDLGSNSFHLVVARLDAGQLVVVDRLREMVQLAAGLDGTRNLTRETRDRALECLGRFGQRVRHMPPGSVRAVGTNTLRSARNARRFVGEAEAALGHSIETISGIEEARLIFLGVAYALPDAERRRLVLDIGGGSTEIAVGRGAVPELMDSLFTGSVGMTRDFFPEGEIAEAALERAELAAAQQFEPLRAGYAALGWDQAVGCSGTVRAIHAVIAAEELSRRGITPKALRRLREALLRAGHVDKLRLASLSPSRAPIFPAGVALLSAAFESLGIDELQVSDGALREGVLYDLLGRYREDDVRDRSVAALCTRCHVDLPHAGRVEETALALLAQVAPTWDLGHRAARQMLGWAARLHEIGLDIAHRHYHKHGQYLIAQSDLFGFSREEQRALAVLVRAHRRKFPAGEIDELPAVDSRVIERLAVLLRLAVVLHRSRSPDPLPSLALEVGKRSVVLGFPERWLGNHPLTSADLREEQEFLRAAGVKLQFR